MEVKLSKKKQAKKVTKTPDHFKGAEVGKIYDLPPVEIKSEPAWEFVWNASRWLVALGVVLSQIVITIGLLIYLAKHCW